MAHRALRHVCSVTLTMPVSRHSETSEPTHCSARCRHTLRRVQLETAWLAGSTVWHCLHCGTVANKLCSRWAGRPLGLCCTVCTVAQWHTNCTAGGRIDRSVCAALSGTVCTVAHKLHSRWAGRPLGLCCTEFKFLTLRISCST